MIATQDLERELQQFTGTEQYYYNALNKNIRYTDGFKYFLEKAECYWFLVIILTEIINQAKKWTADEGDEFFVLRLTVSTKNTATISVRSENKNGEDKIIWTKNIEFTDAPEGEWKFYLTNNVLLLPSEY
jgi:hypothetical protein